jgi:hypothetical protein
MIVTLDGEQIRRLMIEVADEVSAAGDGPRVVVVVGGSLLALHGMRDATRDVDSSRPIDDEIRRATSIVAERHGLAANWLNDHAAPWAPATMQLDDCDVIVDRPGLRVLSAPFRDVFLMKLNRSSPQDLNDLRALWPHVRDGFTSATAVVDAFHAAFPLEEPDEHLGGFVAAELAKAGYDLPLR